MYDNLYASSLQKWFRPLYTVTCYNIHACLKIRLCCNEKSFVRVGNDFYTANRVKYLQKNMIQIKRGGFSLIRSVIVQFLQVRIFAVLRAFPALTVPSIAHLPTCSLELSAGFFKVGLR